MNEWRDTVKMGQIFEMPGSFYPTPAALIDKMLSGIDFNYKQNFLEPSAGKGNIIRRLFEKANSESALVKKNWTQKLNFVHSR